MQKTLFSSLVALFPFVSLLLFLNPVHAGQLIVEKGVIANDTIWQGEVLVTGDVEVAEGVTLQIMPGTVVRFKKIQDFGSEKLFTDKKHHFPRIELFVKGRLYAQGTAEEKIIFTSAEEKPEPGDWGSLNFMNSVDNILEYCEFLYGQTAVHCHSAQVVISNNLFSHNGTAIGQKNLKGNPIKCVVPMLYNRITENGGGILFGGGTTPVISHNEITDNVFFGIYVKKGGNANIRYNTISRNGKGVIFYVVKGVLLRDNNIMENLDYNISLLEGQSNDIVAHANWWGTTDLEKMHSLVLDSSRDTTLGTVQLDKYLKKPVAGAGIL